MKEVSVANETVLEVARGQPAPVFPLLSALQWPFFAGILVLLILLPTPDQRLVPGMEPLNQWRTARL